MIQIKVFPAREEYTVIQLALGMYRRHFDSLELQYRSGARV